MTETDRDKTYSWFQTERGVGRETLDYFGVTVTETGDLVFPYESGNKVRPNPTKPLGERPRFSFPKGKTPSLFKPKEFSPSASVAFLCEGESDTMRLYQELAASNFNSDVLGLGGIHTWQRTFAAELENYSQVYVILDNDQDYKVSAQVDHVWLHQLRHDIGPKAKRVRLPDGIKDVCEFFEFHDLTTLRKLAKRSVSRYRPLDLTVEPPPTEWLLEGLIASSDLALCAGAEGLGKSMISMALTVAIADELPEALGLPVLRAGRVLYVDEENPRDVVYHRLKRMGLKNTQNVRYLWNNGIRLDKDPDEFLAEALDFNPEMIVLDSLSRVHSLEENDMGSIGPLFNEVLRPLARETEAAVFLIHHHDKMGNGPRGSGDIAASVDTIINCYKTPAKGVMQVELAKSRRRQGGDVMKVRIADKADGSLALEALDYMEMSM